MVLPLPIEETNLAGIGSDEDKAAREAAAKIEFQWQEGVVGSKPGVEIWRVENQRTDNDTPDFGIKSWPLKMHGKFHRGDSYIVLVTTKDPSGGDKLLWDIHFWIGSESTQDEYGVAAYKAVELDDLLGGGPLQHREVEGRESKGFVNCFPRGITYLEGGVDSGFRKVSEDDDEDAADFNHLYKVCKKSGEQAARCFQVPLKCSSLNDGDAFLLDSGDKVFTWFGSTVSAFEKSKSAQVAHNIRENRIQKCELILDVEDDNEEFWELLGGKGVIKPAEDDTKALSESVEKKMFVLSDAGGSVKVKEVPLAQTSLVSDDVCMVDTGNAVYVWIGKGSTNGEKQQAMVATSRYLKGMGRHGSTCVTRVMEGQERRCRPFLKVF
mmetsp:Transcript_18112/g.32762  ORF Transcript_18112/g.32762 Transcript_18112/m.32762 type:complete len:381 (+) Transcript_18112:98-1240(+)|eukprot:CAMPEP_0201601740 /NCGR_PEP_ID=MMETSP0492-20130828/2638_1 /ASSEMBLY_ACC=CAM_ASM_000837 /TAXON_ID=420259 /ORGANISM="Thalassiosira gravida, Strain GMp14c1" /LENGTH=380 /DNA_ID=CAMNT_0048065057 /DNA_START=75 /DNA_END=1217 /DNA_ORIENTATION=-